LLKILHILLSFKKNVINLQTKADKNKQKTKKIMKTNIRFTKDIRSSAIPIFIIIGGGCFVYNK